MLLNNFSNILSAKLTYGSGTNLGDKVNYIKTTDGRTYEKDVNTNNIYLNAISNNNKKEGIRFILSNDKNEINYYDYNIDYIDDELTEIGTTINNSNNYIISKIVKNNTNDNINISSIGLIVCSYINGSYKDILIYKSKLNETIIIEPGETKTFTITIG